MAYRFRMDAMNDLTKEEAVLFFKRVCTVFMPLKVAAFPTAVRQIILNPDYSRKPEPVHHDDK